MATGPSPARDLHCVIARERGEEIRAQSRASISRSEQWESGVTRAAGGQRPAALMHEANAHERRKRAPARSLPARKNCRLRTCRPLPLRRLIYRSGEVRAWMGFEVGGWRDG